MKNLSAVLTAHNEGAQVGDALDSIIENLKKSLLKEYEVLIGIDNGDDETLKVVAEYENKYDFISSHTFQLADVGQVRQELLNRCQFDFVSFLDGDDIWGKSWILKAIFDIKKYKDAIFHPDLTVFFDEEIRYVRKNPDSTSRKFKKEILLFENLWTSSFITPKKIMQEIPMKGGGTYDELTPYAYEDWSWFRDTLIAGYQHRVVKNTVHFQRIKSESNTSRSLKLKKEPWPIDINKLLS